MYDQILVKKRLSKKVAIIVVAFSTTGVTSLGIISFLGRHTGTFTVSLRNQEVSLTLSEKKAFTDTTSFLRINQLKPFEETTFNTIYSAQPDDERLDYTFGAHLNPKTNTIDSFEFFKYTFYVKNVGSSTATYTLRVNNIENTAANDGSGRKLDDTLRVMIYENDLQENEDYDTHDYKVYAKAAAERNFLKDGTPTYKEFVSKRPYDRKETDEYKLVDGTFVSDSVIAEYKVSDFKKGDIKRYTLVTWLEGEDPQSSSEYEAPEGATIKLGVEITAYENKIE